MEKINKFFIPGAIIIGCIILGVFYYINQSRDSAYKMEADCSNEAKILVNNLDKETMVFRHSISESHFNKEKMSCFIEYTASAMGTEFYSINYLYDLTHNKQITELLPLKMYAGDTKTYTENARYYDELKRELLNY